jgi:multiple antibiotic resistance protein
VESLVQAVVAVLAIADPLGAVPVFLGLTRMMTAEQRTRAANRTALAVGVILAATAVGGSWVLALFGISLAAFRVGGGLVVVLMGLEMLGGRRTRVQPGESDLDADGEDAILVPLAMPLIAGPGAIATVMALSARATSWRARAEVFAAVAVTTLAVLATLRSARWIQARMSGASHRILLRFMGLILVAIGAQLLLSGVREFFSG